MDRITAIQKSLTTFVWGIFGMVPVLGLVPAIRALVLGRAVRLRYRDEWNPAARYLRAGVVLAVLGILNNVLTVAVIALAITMD